MKGYLRDATEDDMELLFIWANDAEVRQNSFSTHRITYEEHQQWYQRLLIQSDCKQYIYMNDEEPVGQIRITIVGDSAEIGYSVCAEKRGQGYGKIMLQMLCEKVRQEFPEIKKLTAKVKPENRASQKTFEAVGYKEIYHALEFNVI